MCISVVGAKLYNLLPTQERSWLNLKARDETTINGFLLACLALYFCLCFLIMAFVQGKEQP